jgi:hypothetical protein
MAEDEAGPRPSRVLLLRPTTVSHECFGTVRSGPVKATGL